MVWSILTERYGIQLAGVELRVALGVRYVRLGLSASMLLECDALGTIGQFFHVHGS